MLLVDVRWQVKSVRMIADKNSRRSKGIAYVEFQEYVMANEVLAFYYGDVISEIMWSRL